MCMWRAAPGSAHAQGLLLCHWTGTVQSLGPVSSMLPLAITHPFPDEKGGLAGCAQHQPWRMFRALGSSPLFSCPTCWCWAGPSPPLNQLASSGRECGPEVVCSSRPAPASSPSPRSLCSGPCICFVFLQPNTCIWPWVTVFLFIY